ncbi:MAG: glycosyltransferase family 2 protein [Erysipelotrichaceae bacterium]
MKDITVIILTKNEEKNIEESVKSAKLIAERVIVVDSGSTDRTIELAEKSGAETCFHEWPGHAAQFNWALDNCMIKTTWVFRLDADERVSEKLAAEIIAKTQDSCVDGYEMRWRVYFMDKWIKYGGTHKPYFLRLFRYEKGRVEEKLMDEHIIVSGKVEKLKGDLIHYDYKGLDAWLDKHIWYSNFELRMYNTQGDMTGGNETQKKKRGMYYRLPLFLRAHLYFWYRYYVQLGFLDGKEGKIFIYLQAYWFRFLVDAKIYEEEKCGDK